MGYPASGMRGVSGISSSSMNPIQGISYRSTVNQAYTVENKSDFSDAFVDSVKGLSSADSVMGPSPVVYPTATVMTKKIGQIEDSVRANEGFNSIASGFAGATTGYGRAGDGMGYGVIGAGFDSFA